MSFPRYPRYKDSGVEWLGEVPEHWDVTHLKRVATIRYGIGEPPIYRESGTPLVRATNVHGGRLYEESMAFVDPEDIPVKRIIWLAPGDIVVVRSGAYTGDSAIIPHTLGAAIAGFDMVLTCTGAIPMFVQYALLSDYLKENQIDLERTRAAQPHLNAEELGSCVFIRPSWEEQQSIVAFLNVEISTIDHLIAEQRSLIDLLQEKRQAAISHAVTRGLEPDAPMKSSGVDWLGDVPAHWRVERMKRVARMESGHTPDKKIPAYWENCDIPWVSLNDTAYLRENDYISETAFQINELGIANSSARLLPARAVVFSRDATIGRCAITTRPMAVSQHFIAWIAGPSILPEFLLLRLRSMSQELDRLTTGATLKTIGMPDVRTLVTPVPPIKEQEEIVRFVQREAAQIDALVVEAERAIALLQERRTALISAAVTGKIDVRNLAEVA
jgi:type I restriction enzyme S subunit